MTKNMKLTAPAHLLGQWDTTIKAEAGKGEIAIFDVIDPDWGVSAAQVRQKLSENGQGAVTVLINSPGGDSSEGVTIYNLLKQHKGRVTVKVMGMAASAASVIAMAGDEIQMLTGSMLMVHNAWTIAVGNRKDLSYVVGLLDKVDSSMRDIYIQEAGIEEETLKGLMDEETYLTAKEAVEVGFANTVLEEQPSREHSNSLAARRTIDAALRAQGLTRSQRRKLLKQLKAPSTPTAAVEHNTPSAVDLGETAALAATLENILGD